MRKGKRTITATGATEKTGSLSKKALINAYRDSKPLMTAEASTGSTSGTRMNVAAITTRSSRYANIEEGIIPFKYSSAGYVKTSNIDIKDAVVLCQKAYYNVAVFRNTIDLMTEFSTGEIYFKGGSKKSRDFFRAWWRKINGNDFQDKFYREYYRSGNVIILRFDGEVQNEDLLKINQTFASESIVTGKDVMNLPVRYIILNPADVQVGGTLNFSNARYFKVLTDYEIERLKNPKTDEDREVLAGLSKDVRDQIKKVGNISVILPLDPDKTSAVFYKKQDYEPFAVPMGFPVLEDINWKLELKKMDAAMARTMQQVILLVTMGAEPDKGGVSQKHLEAMKAFFENNSVGRVLVADYTTEAKFVIPEIANLLDPKKYEMVNRDILQGLNNVFLGGNTSGDGEKFANTSIKAKIFIERLKQGRQIFLTEFLIPEIKRIAKEIGLKNYPNPEFEDIDFKDELEFAKLYTQWLNSGVLTPAETIVAVSTGQLPSTEESVENQRTFKKLKDEGLYEPILGGPATQKEITDKQITSQEKIGEAQRQVQVQMSKDKLSVQKGRPKGSSAPKKKMTPVGGSIEESYNLSKIKDVMLLSDKLHKSVEKNLIKKHGITELSEQQKEIAGNISEIIIANEEPENWLTKIEDYLVDPIGKNEARTKAIDEIAASHGLNNFLAALLYASKK